MDNDVIFLVFGVEQYDRLISCTCPHCQLKEWRCERGWNWCENTGDKFYLSAPEFVDEDDPIQPPPTHPNCRCQVVKMGKKA